jgi:hypothetical protein
VKQTPTPLRVQIIDEVFSAIALAEKWQTLFVSECSNNFTQSSTWNISWLIAMMESFQREKLKLRIIALYNGNELVGIAPFVLNSNDRTLYFLTNTPPFNPYPEYVDILYNKSFYISIRDTLLENLQSNSLLKASSYDFGLSLEGSLLHFLFNKVSANILSLKLSIPSFTAKLPQTFEQYLSTRTYKRSLSVKIWRKAIKEEVLNYFPKTLSGKLEAFEELVALHQAQWQRRGEWGAFFTHELRNYYRRLVIANHLEENHSRSQIALSVTKKGNKTLGVIFYLPTKNGVIQLLSGFDTASTEIKSANIKSIGVVSHLLSIAHFIKEDVAVYDLLSGENDLKLMLTKDGNEEYPPLVALRGSRRAFFSLQGGVKWLLSLILLGITLAFVDLTSLKKTLEGISFKLLIFSTLIYLGAQTLSAIKWWVILSAAEIRVSFRKTLIAYYYGMFVNTLGIGTVGGDMTRAILVAKGVSTESTLAVKSKAFFSVIADRAHGLAVLSGIGSLTALTTTHDFLPVSIERSMELIGILLVGLWLIVTFMPKYLTKLNFSLGSKIASVAAVFPSSLWSIFLITSLSLVFHLTQIALHTYIAWGVNADTPLVAFLVVVPFVNIASSLPLSWQGLGVRENAFNLLLVPAYLTSDKAVALGAIWLFSSTGAAFLAFLIARTLTLLTKDDGTNLPTPEGVDNIPPR